MKKKKKNSYILHDHTVASAAILFGESAFYKTATNMSKKALKNTGGNTVQKLKRIIRRLRSRHLKYNVLHAELKTMFQSIAAVCTHSIHSVLYDFIHFHVSTEGHLNVPSEF